MNNTFLLYIYIERFIPYL